MYCHFLVTLTCHGTLFDKERVNADDIIEKCNFMTRIPATRCLKILCKFSFVAKNMYRLEYITNQSTTNEF